jgi:hypothetical protein
MMKLILALIFTIITGGSIFAAPPANDNFVGRQILTGSSVSVSGTTVDATAQTTISSEKDIDGADSPAPSVWYAWVVPTGVTSALITATFNDSTPGECIAWVFGTPSSKLVGGLAQYRSAVAGRTFIIGTTPGETIYLRVAEAPTVLTGSTFTLAIAVNQLRSRPANDFIATPTVLPNSENFSVTGTLSDATTDINEWKYAAPSPNFDEAAQASAVWYRWTAPSGGVFGVSIIGPALADMEMFNLFDPRTPIQYGEAGGGRKWQFSASSGQTYLFKVSTLVGIETIASRGGGFTLILARPPSGDLAIPPFGLLPQNYDLRGASGSGDPNLPGTNRAAQDVHIPLSSGLISPAGVMEVGPVNPEVIDLTVYQVLPGLSNFGEVARNKGSTTCRYTAVANGIYIARISLKNRNAATLADLQGTLTFIPLASGGVVPGNDSFANATTLGTAGLIASTGTTAGASGEVMESFSERGDVVSYDIPNRSVWYQVTPASSGQYYLFAVDQDGVRMHVRLLQGALGFFSRLGEDSELSETGMSLSAGVTYHISVDETDRPSHGTFTLYLSRAGTLDNFVNASNISNISGATQRTAGVSTMGATLEAGEPGIGGSSIWYRCTAPNATPIYLNTFGSTYDTVLTVYTGSALTGLTEIAMNDDFGGADNRSSALNFTPTSGTSYYIRISGFSNRNGVARLNSAGLNTIWTPYFVWAMNYRWSFGTDLPMSDPDNDGLVNLQELAFGGNPLVAENVRENRPATSPVTLVRPGGSIALSYRAVPSNLIGQGIGTPISVIAQGSSNLSTWSTRSTTLSAGNTIAEAPVSPSGKGFVRTKVSD